MRNLISWLKNEESGQGMIEYGLIIVLIAVVVIVALRALGPRIAQIFTDIGDEMPEADA